jgi:hypothetical protein
LSSLQNLSLIRDCLRNPAGQLGFDHGKTRACYTNFWKTPSPSQTSYEVFGSRSRPAVDINDMYDASD